MKISKRQLRRIIREEKANVIAEQRFRKVVRAALIAESRGELTESFLDKLKGFFGKKKKGMSEEDAKKLGKEMAGLEDELKTALKRVANLPPAKLVTYQYDAAVIMRLYNQRDALKQLSDQLRKMRDGAFGTDNPDLVDELTDLMDDTDGILSYLEGSNSDAIDDLEGMIIGMKRDPGSNDEAEAVKYIEKRATSPMSFDSLSAPF